MYTRLKIIAVFLGIAFVLNFGFNFWIQNRLPDFIKNNTNYVVNYEKLKVNIFTRSITAKNLQVETIENKNFNSVKINGQIPSLKISGIGIFSIIFKDKISVNNIFLDNPNILIELPNNNRSNKNVNISLGKTNIKNGTIYIYQNKKLSLASKNLNLNVKNIKITREPALNLSISDIDFKNSKLSLYENNKINGAKSSLGIALKKASINNLELEVIGQNNQKVFYSKNINLDISNFFTNDIKNSPFSYKNFNIYAEKTQLNIQKNIKITVDTINISPTKFSFTGSSIASTHKPNSGTQIVFLNADKIAGSISKWQIKDKRLFADIEHITGKNIFSKINQINRKERNIKYKNSDIGLINIQKIMLENINIIHNNTLDIKNLNIDINNLSFDGNKTKYPAYNIESYQINSQSLSYKTKYYNIQLGKTNISDKQFTINNININPRYSRNQFIRIIPKEKDLYTIRTRSITGSGTWDFTSQTPSFYMKHIKINNANVNIYRSTIPPDDNSTRHLYSKILRKLPFPLAIQNTEITNSHLEYEEDTEKSIGAGKIILSKLNGNIKNLHSGKAKVSSSIIPISIYAQFMNDSSLKALWVMNTASTNDYFTIKGTLTNLNAEKINKFITPYMKVKAEGQINQLTFDFTGNNTGIQGKQKIDFQDLKVTIINEKGEKRGFLTTVANIFVRGNSNAIPKEVEIDKVEREPNRSFFNLFWQGILAGLKKQLL